MGSYTADEFNKYLMDDDIMVLWRYKQKDGRSF